MTSSLGRLRSRFTARRTRMQQMRIAAFGVLMALGISITIGAGADPAEANIVTPPGCADVLFIGARGSGNHGPGTPGWTPTAADPYGLGGTVEAVRQYLRNGLGARRSVATISVEYPANAVTTVPFRPDVYFAGLSSGEAWVENTLAARNCPGEAIVLAGFSQGAMVMHRAIRHWIATNDPLKDRVAAAVLVGDGDRVPNDNTIIDGFASPGKQGIGLDWTAQSGSTWTRFPTALHDKLIEVCEPDDLVCDQPSTSVAALATHLGYSQTSASIHLAGTQAVLRVLDVPRPSPLSWCTPPGVAVSAQIATDVLGGATLQWRLQPGSSLPPGITLQGDGTLVGTRSTSGSRTTVVQVRNTLPTPATAWVPATVTFTTSCARTGPRIVPLATASVSGTLRQDDTTTWTFPLTNSGDATWAPSQVIVNVITPSGAGYLVPCAGGTSVSVPPGGTWSCAAAMDIDEIGTSVGTLYWQAAGLWYDQTPTYPWSASATVKEGPLTGTGTTPAAATLTVGDYTTLTSVVRNDASKAMTFGWIDYYVTDPDGRPVFAACQADTNITLAPGQSWTCQAGFRADKRGSYHGFLKYRLPSGTIYDGPHPAGSDLTWTSGSIPTVYYAEPGWTGVVGAAQISLHGKNLNGATAVTFGGVPAEVVSNASPDLLFVKAPAHAAGSAPIVVTGLDGASNPIPFEYRAPGAPAVRGSLGAGGTEANAASTNPSLSSDGAWVAFQSAASNLVAGDTNGAQDVFVRNTVAGTTVRATDNPFRSQADGPSRDPSLSADGQRVAFESDATDLWTQATTPGHIWVRQMSNSALFPVDVAAGINNGLGNSPAAHPSIDNAGRYVAYESAATNLIPGDTGTVSKIYVRDMNTSSGIVTVDAATDASGAAANGPSTDPAISGDGKVVAFKSWATNLVPGDTGRPHPGLYVKQLNNGTVTRVDLSNTGEAGNGTTLSAPSLDYSGMTVAFSTDASNLDLSDSNGVDDVYERTVNIGGIGINEFIWRASLSDSMTQSSYPSYNPVMARSGTDRVAFLHDGSDLGSESGPSASTQVYVKGAWQDLSSRTPAGTGSAGHAAHLSLSGDLSSVAFDSDAMDLVTGDANGVRDVFVSPVPAEESTPAQVTDISAVPSSQHAVLTWTAVPGVHPVEYVVRLWDSPSGGNEVAPLQVVQSPFAVFSGLTDGQTVYAEVTSQNGQGQGQPSPRVAVTAQAVVPESPINVHVSAPVRIPPSPSGDGDGLWSVDVTWDEPPTSPGVTFEARGFTPDPAGRLAAASGIGANDPHTASLVLEAGRTFTILVVARNSVGDSVANTQVTVTTPPVPAWAPIQPTATPGSTTAAVSWQPPLYTGGAPLNSYTVLSSPGGRSCTSTTTSCTVTGLTNGVSYTFTVRANTAAGAGTPSAPTAPVIPATRPSAVRSLALGYPTSLTATLTWLTPTSNGGQPITAYLVRQRLSTSSTWSGWANVGTATSYTAKNLNAGSQYYLQVAAQNAVGTGPAVTVLTHAMT